MKKSPFIMMLCMSIFSMPCFATSISPRIIGGEDAQITDVPWQAYIRIGFSFCGGAVVGERWVLTAAHCMDLDTDSLYFTQASLANIRVYTGTNAPNDTSVENTISQVTAIYVYPDYSKGMFENDLALLELETPINTNASPVQLANAKTQLDLDATADLGMLDLLITGFGDISPDRDNTTYPSVLQQTWVPLISDLSCSASWGSSLSRVENYQDKYLCNQAIGSGSCNGDSGGPVIWYDPSYAADTDGGARLVGLVSFGVAEVCASSFYPDVNTQIATYQSWIATCMDGGDCPSLEAGTELFPTSSESSSSGGAFLFLGLPLLWLRRFLTS